MKPTRNIIPLILVIASLFLTGCSSEGEKALEAVVAKELSGSHDPYAVIAEYRAVGARYPDISERALENAARLQAFADAEALRKRRMVEEETARVRQLLQGTSR